MTAIRILVLNGPNLNLLGKREPEIYGSASLKDIDDQLATAAEKIGTDHRITVQLECRQSNSESDLISWIGEAPGKFEGIIINPAAFTHTSIGLLDAIRAVAPNDGVGGVPSVEVHLSNTQAREEFRQKSLTAQGCIAQVAGFQAMSYILALEGIVHYILDRMGAGE